VVAFHFGPAAGVGVGPVLGPIMVTFFFVLSGFVLAITYLPRPHLDTGRFLVNRFSRIGPIYYVALAAMLLILWRQGRELHALSAALDLAFLQAWIPSYPLDINPPAWSLSVEAAMYFSFPAAASFVRARSARVVLGAAGAAWLLTQVALSLVLSRTDYADTGPLHDLVYYWPPAHWCSFALGIAGGHWYLREGKAAAGRWTALALLAVAVAIVPAILGEGSLRQVAGIPIALASSFLAPLFLALVLSVAVAPAWVGRLLAPPPFVALGNASYSLYILQLPAYLLFCQFFIGRAAYTPAQLFAFACVLAVVSVAAYYLFERPVMRAIRGLWASPAIAPAPAVDG